MTTEQKLNKEQRRQRSANIFAVIVVVFILLCFGLLSIVYLVDWQKVDRAIDAFVNDKPLIAALGSIVLLIVVSIYLLWRK